MCRCGGGWRRGKDQPLHSSSWGIHTVISRQSLPGIQCFLISLSKLPTKSRVLSVSTSQSWGWEHVLSCPASIFPSPSLCAHKCMYTQHRHIHARICMSTHTHHKVYVEVYRQSLMVFMNQFSPSTLWDPEMGIRCSDSVANICTDLDMCQASWPGFPQMLGIKVQFSSTPRKRFDGQSSPMAFSMFSLYFLKLVWTGTVDAVKADSIISIGLCLGGATPQELAPWRFIWMCLSWKAQPMLPLAIFW